VRSREEFGDKVCADHFKAKKRKKAYPECWWNGEKLATQASPEWLIHEKEMQRGNRNRATLAGQEMVAWMVAVNAEKVFGLRKVRRHGVGA